MPTLLRLNGWRYYFYANEGIEPMHVHARKAGMECKFWLIVESRAAVLAFSNGLSPRELREVRKTIDRNFELIEQTWLKFERRKLK
jgi:hypothetical protein